MCSVIFTSDVPQETRNATPFTEINTEAKNELEGCVIYIFHKGL